MFLGLTLGWIPVLTLGLINNKRATADSNVLPALSNITAVAATDGGGGTNVVVTRSNTDHGSPLEVGLLFPVVLFLHQPAPEQPTPVFAASAEILQVQSKVSENKTRWFAA